MRPTARSRARPHRQRARPLRLQTRRRGDARLGLRVRPRRALRPKQDQPQRRGRLHRRHEGQEGQARHDLRRPHGVGPLQLRRDAMDLTLNAVYLKVPEGYIGFVEELPGANTQGATLEEARENLKEAVELVLEANRALADEAVKGEEV